MESEIASAVINEITRRVISKVIENYNGNKKAAVEEKLQKLEMLCTRIHGTVEISEKHLITNNNVLKWQEELKEAAIDGDEVLFTFHWRALNQDTANTVNQNATFCPLAYTKIALSSIVYYFHNAAKVLLSLDEDVKKLNSTVDKLAKLSADIEGFLRLVELHVYTDEENAPTKGKNTVNCENSVSHLQQDEHKPSNRKRPFDSVLDSTKMLETAKRAMRVRFFSFSIV